MTNFTYYILIIILILYIVSPLDLHPLIFDDLIASGFCTIYGKSSQNKKDREIIIPGPITNKYKDGIW